MRLDTYFFPHKAPKSSTYLRRFSCLHIEYPMIFQTHYDCQSEDSFSFGTFSLIQLVNIFTQTFSKLILHSFGV